MEMQLDVYASGSSNVARIAARARLLANMFMDMKCLQIEVTKVTEWLSGGTKTAGSSAKTALALAERFAAERFFADLPLVKAQASPAHDARAATEPPKPARPLTWRHIEALEATIVCGNTVQQRVMAGFFTFLVHSSHRCSNGQRTRKLQLTDDALLGESLLKGRAS